MKMAALEKHRFVLLSRFFMSLDISGPTSEFDDN